MKMAKAPNYTKEQTAELRAAYKAADSQESRDAVVEAFAQKFGKTKPSVRQKLVREGVYVAKEYETKTGEKPETKEAIVEEMAKLIGCSADQLSGFERATKSALRRVRSALQDNAATA